MDTIAVYVYATEECDDPDLKEAIRKMHLCHLETGMGGSRELRNLQIKVVWYALCCHDSEYIVHPALIDRCQALRGALSNVVRYGVRTETIDSVADIFEPEVNGPRVNPH